MIRCFSFTDYGAFESNRAYADLNIRKGYDKKSKESIVVKYLNKKNILFENNKKINISSSKIKRDKLKNS